MGSNSSVSAKDAEQVVAPLERPKPPKQTTLSQLTPSAKVPSNLMALKFIAIPLQDTNHDKTSVSVESTTPLSEQATASDKETTPGESSSHAQVMQDGEWLSREVERLAKKELDLEERENHLRERRLEINEQNRQLSTKEEDIMLRRPKLKLELELKRKEFDDEKERLQSRYAWLVVEGIQQQRGELWLDRRQLWLHWGSSRRKFSCCSDPSPSLLQKSEWERKRRLQTEEMTKDQQYRFKELHLKREVEKLKREDQRLRKKERRIEFEEAEVDREVERLVERNRELLSEEIKLRDDEYNIRCSFERLKRAERYLEEKEKEIGKTASEQAGRYLD